MHRREWLFGASASLLGRTTPPPNILLVVVDDWGATDLSCYGSNFYSTPNIDKLAGEGMRFTQAYSACTVCSPSRAAILTGQYPARLHLTDWIAGHRYPHAKLLPPHWTQHLLTSTNTLAEGLRSRGYRSASIGKWHLGGPAFWPDKHGFDRNIGGTHQGQPPSYFSPYSIPSLTDGPKGEYLTDRLYTEATRFIEENRAQPFFVYLPHYAVHTPLQAPKPLVARYDSQTDPQGKPTYAAMVESVDAGLGRLLRRLKDLNLERNTIVVLTSDNGGLQRSTRNIGLREGKGTPYEGGTRVPLIVRWPGIVQPNTECDVPVIGIDLYPTLLRGAGVRTAAADGLDLTPLLTKRGKFTRDALYWHYPHYHSEGATPHSTIREGNRKLIHFYEDDRVELYDLSADPTESTDIASKYPAEAARLRKRLEQWRASVNAQPPLPNPNYDPVRATQRERT